jgi:hypothetical protein
VVVTRQPVDEICASCANQAQWLFRVDRYVVALQRKRGQPHNSLFIHAPLLEIHAKAWVAGARRAFAVQAGLSASSLAVHHPSRGVQMIHLMMSKVAAAMGERSTPIGNTATAPVTTVQYIHCLRKNAWRAKTYTRSVC